MLEEYYGFMVAVPGFGSEVAHRVVELIKVFNSRSCQLVLGAGAMAAAGLKSITAKHLALSCQCLSFFVALQPEVREVFSDGAHMAEHRKALLAPEMGRLLQDLALHRDEIYSKLVAIMRERLLSGARQLPQAAEKWGAGAAAAGGGGGGGVATKRPRPTAFAESTAKQLRVLRSVLVPLLNADDLTAVFGRISGLFGTTLADSYARLEDPGGAAAAAAGGGGGGGMSAWEAQRCADSVHLLQALQELPVGRQDLEANLQPLHRFCKQRYGAAPEIGDASHHASTPSSSSSASSRRASSSGGAAAIPPPAAAADSVAKAAAEDITAATHEVPVSSRGVADSPLVPAEPVASIADDEVAVLQKQANKEEEPELPREEKIAEEPKQAKEEEPIVPREEKVAEVQEQQEEEPELPKEEEIAEEQKQANKEEEPEPPREEKVAEAQEQQEQEPELPKEEEIAEAEEVQGQQEHSVHPLLQKEEEEREVAREQQRPNDEVEQEEAVKEEASELWGSRSSEVVAATNAGSEEPDSAAARASEAFPSSACAAAAYADAASAAAVAVAVAAAVAVEASAAEEQKGREPHEEAAGPEEPAEELKEAEGEAEAGEDVDGWGGEEEDADGWGGWGREDEDGDAWEDDGAAAKDE